MDGLFASGQIVDFILILMLVELAAVLWSRRLTRGAIQSFALTLVSGACLLLALRGALTGAWWGLIALALFGGLLAHLADLARRLTSAKAPL